ncbi:MAG: AraC family transcriptional regulator [Bacteroidia bacterium]|nr:AraC family transcriptional regulator [Bacteroidia bacterium]
MELSLAFTPITLFVVLVVALSTICVFGGIVVQLCAIKTAATKYLAFLCFFWALVEISPLFLPLDGTGNVLKHFSPLYLISCAILGDLSLLYPLIMIEKNRVTIPKLLRFFSGIIIILLSYFIYRIFNPEPKFVTPANIATPGLAIEVIFRFLFLVYLTLHALYVAVMVRKFIPIYEKYLDESYSDTEKKHIQWMKVLKYPMFAILISYMAYTFNDTIELSIVHLLLLMFIISIFIIKAIQTEPVELPEHCKMYWSYKNFKWIIVDDIKDNEYKSAEADEFIYLSDNELTENEICRYKSILDQWMLQDKPYLNKDFRVSDVHTKLNVDRLKCNEIFSRAYQCYFRNWVLQYRIDHAIQLMKDNPDKQVKEISFESGFTSQAVFARSFAQHMGMSCTQYKEQFLI